MTNHCQRCNSTTFAIDFAADEPVVVGCVDCRWSALLQGDRCVSPTRLMTGAVLGRCSRIAILNGACWQHADKGEMYDRIFHWMRNGAHDLIEDLPDVYRRALSLALVDARLIEHHERETDRVDELAAQAASLRRSGMRPPVATPKRPVVYFVRREGLIKIGTTGKLEERIKAISKGSSMPDGMTVGPVELLATVAGDKDFEGRLHRQFERDRIDNTEWFRSSPRLLRLIARYQRRAEEQEALAAA